MTTLVLREPGSDEALALWGSAKEPVALTVGYLEVRGVIARTVRPRARARARALLDSHWESIETVDVDDSLIARAIAVVDRHRLRAIDALHLAAALSVGDAVLATRDAELARAAQSVGLAVLA